MPDETRTASGVVVHPERGLLVERALDVLAAGPADATTLVAHVCQQPGTPAAVAEHLALTLLGAHREFVRLPDGRWALARAANEAREAVRRARSAPEGRTTVGCATPGDDDRLADLSYVVVDVETTGGRAHGDDRITEIAAVVVRDGEVADVWQTLVNPQRAIPPWITRLTNITWEMVADKPTFRELCDDVLRAITGHVFVAHNATFDWSFVSAEVERATGATLSGRRLCTVRLSRRLLPQLPRRSLDWVARYYGVEIEARHRAAGDALATARVLQRLLDDAQDRGIETWGALEAFLATSTGRRRKRRPSAFPQPVDRDTTA